MIRKILSAAAAVCIAVSMTACGSSDSSGSSSAASAANTETTVTSAAQTQQETSSAAEEQTEKVTSESAAETPEKTYELEYWTEGSAPAEAIREFVADVTDEASENYLPTEKRIAVFDVDGTLFGERYPTYFDQCLLMHRMNHDDNYPDKDKNPEDKKYVEALEKSLFEGAPAPKSDKSSSQMLAEAFKGFTVDEFRAYVREYMSTPAYGFEGMTYGEGFYKPMVSVVRYLYENGFQVFIVSGGERTYLRELTKGTLDKWIPPYNVIGTTFSLTAEKQGDTAGRSYTYAPDDRVLYEGNMTFKNVKMNKVVSIIDEIGAMPVISFGNSTGDTAMAQYIVQNGGKAFMLLCDDTERDYGSIEEAETFAADCQARGFTTVSMKNDFATIYGENVRMNAPEEADEQAAA